jgi:hypothetical protein
MGMMTGMAFFALVFYVARQWSKVRMKSLEVRALELEKGK